MSLDWDDLVETARRQGWRVERGTRHLRLFAPDGVGCVTIAGSAGDWRSIHNSVAHLRRHGFQWRPDPTRSSPSAAAATPDPGGSQLVAALSLAEAVYTRLVDDALTPTELSEQLGCARSQVAMCVSAMAAEGLLGRQERVPRGKRGVAPEWRFTCAHRAEGRPASGLAR